MWTTLPLIAALSLTPAQNEGRGGGLELTNIRATYGMMGPVRTDNKLLPGDMFFVSYDIENVQTDKSGRILYSMGMELFDSKMKTQYKQEPRDQEALNSLGGNRLPAFAHIFVGLDQPAGEYTLRVTVTDRAAKATKSFERKFEVLEPGFGLVRLFLTADPQGQTPVPPLGVPGQVVWLHFAVVGFERGGPKKEPDIGLTMQIVDENDKPTLDKPFPGDVMELPKDVKLIPMDFPLALNRVGKFTVRLKATDRRSKRTAELTYPIQVVDVK